MKFASLMDKNEDSNSELDDSGIGLGLDTTTTTSYSPQSSTFSHTATTSATRSKVLRNRDTGKSNYQNSILKQSTGRKHLVAMARKAVKKAAKTRQKMENAQARRQRHIQLIEQLCKEENNGEEKNTTTETKKEEFEEPPPRPPTRRCMFYREDTDVAKILRSKQL
ncbi:hypothetical protein L5515_016227 [Caenorhabditis briggsae]|uniref:Uncharacterized protein n=3 Tax=Caenorhabditis briggsae TaxID=6238 RepID=A0AAE9JPM7_CAEBR|nr:hypothetical protein L5515_016227 [Caenorhabditis briggsae]